MGRDSALYLIALLILIGFFSVFRIGSELKALDITYLETVDSGTYRNIACGERTVSISRLLKERKISQIEAVLITEAEIKSNPKAYFEKLELFGLPVIIPENLRLPDHGEIPAYYAGLKIVRAHEVPQDEALKLNDTEISRRFRRAAVERGIRVFILPAGRSYLKTRIDPLLKRKISLKVEPVRYFSSGMLGKLILFISFILAAFIINKRVKNIGVPVWTCLLMSVYLIFSYAARERWFLFLYLLSLNTATIFGIQSALINGRLDHLRAFLLIAVLGIGCTALFSSIEYQSYILRYRGIKIGFIIPFIASLIQAAGILYLEKRSLKEFGVFFAGLAIVFLFLIILKTGNGRILYSKTEGFIREGLERTFYFRPRFKEFVIGYPVLILALKKMKTDIRWIILLPVGMVSYISVLNTFQHLSHPLYVNVAVSILGLLLGTAIGYLLLLLEGMISKRGLRKG